MEKEWKLRCPRCGKLRLISEFRNEPKLVYGKKPYCQYCAISYSTGEKVKTVNIKNPNCIECGKDISKTLRWRFCSYFCGYQYWEKKFILEKDPLLRFRYNAKKLALRKKYNQEMKKVV